MSRDPDYFLEGLDQLDPSSTESIERWCRARQRSSSWRDDEEKEQRAKPEQQTRLTDAEAAALIATLDERITEALDLVAQEAGLTERRLRDEMSEQIQLLRQKIYQLEQQKQRATIFAPGLDIGESLKKEFAGFMAGVRNELGEIRHALELRRMTDPPRDQDDKVLD
jgi:hypothetical protein